MTEHVLIALIAAIGAVVASVISAMALLSTRATQARVDELLSEARRIAHAAGYQQSEDDAMTRDAERHLRQTMPGDPEES